MSLLAKTLHFVQTRFIWLLVASYGVVALFPGPGLALRSMHFGSVSLPVVMLGLLLLNGGLDVDISSLKALGRTPGTLLFGLCANLATPLGFISIVMITMRWWHNHDEVQNILVGLALVASMPIAGSSAAWSQNANGNLALSLGLVIGSTFLSPLTTPISLHAVELMTTGDYSEDLHELAAAKTGWFLLSSVIFPTVLGLAGRHFLGAEWLGGKKVQRKLANSLILLTLNYSNAAVSLPQAVSKPDWDFLAVTLGITFLLCAASFSAGWLIARLGDADAADQAALMFGLGMNNNGTGLVLASMTLADHPQVLLPIIFYNLVQHLVASIVYKFVFSDRANLQTTQRPAAATVNASAA